MEPSFSRLVLLLFAFSSTAAPKELNPRAAAPTPPKGHHAPWHYPLEHLLWDTRKYHPDVDQSMDSLDERDRQIMVEANPAIKQIIKTTRKWRMRTFDVAQGLRKHLEIWPHTYPPQPGRDDHTISKLDELHRQHAWLPKLVPEFHGYVQHGLISPPPFWASEEAASWRHPVTGATFTQLIDRHTKGTQRATAAANLRDSGRQDSASSGSSMGSPPGRNWKEDVFDPHEPEQLPSRADVDHDRTLGMIRTLQQIHPGITHPWLGTSATLPPRGAVRHEYTLGREPSSESGNGQRDHVPGHQPGPALNRQRNSASSHEQPDHTSDEEPSNRPSHDSSHRRSAETASPPARSVHASPARNLDAIWDRTWFGRT